MLKFILIAVVIIFTIKVLKKVRRSVKRNAALAEAEKNYSYNTGKNRFEELSKCAIVIHYLPNSDAYRKIGSCSAGVLYHCSKDNCLYLYQGSTTHPLKGMGLSEK